MNATTTTAPEQLLTYPQAATILGVSTRTVQQLVRTEQIGLVLDAQGGGGYRPRRWPTAGNPSQPHGVGPAAYMPPTGQRVVRAGEMVYCTANRGHIHVGLRDRMAKWAL